MCGYFVLSRMFLLTMTATVHREWFHGMIDLVLIPKYLTFVQMYNLLLIIDNSIQKVKLKVEFYND